MGKNVTKKSKHLRQAFSDILEPKLQELGFVCDFPNYRRVEHDALHLGEIQWGKNGGYFEFEFGYTDLPFVDWSGTEIPSEQATVSHLPMTQRARLCAHKGNTTPTSFQYGDFWEDKDRIDSLVLQMTQVLENASDWLRTKEDTPNVFAF